jgi:lysophospholipase L1-like esterase
MKAPRARHLPRIALLLALILALFVVAPPATALALVSRTARAALRVAAIHPVSTRSARSARTTPARSTPPTPSATPTPTPSSTPTATPTPGPLTVVGLGDSVPAGSDCGCTSYVTLVARELAAQSSRKASVDNLARGGLTTTGLLEQLQTPSVRSAISDADLVIVTIGANDFDQSDLTAADCQPATQLSCYTDTLAALRQKLTTVLSEVRSLQPSDGQIVVTGYWNDFLDGRVGEDQGPTYVAASNALTLASNAVTADVSADEYVHYVDIYTPFKGRDGSQDCTWLLAPDGDHPNAAGHQVIAKAIVTALTG